MITTFKPLIALPAAFISRSGRVPTYEIGETYINAILAAGGKPVLLPSNFPEADWPALIERFDGFLFCGGGDINPHYFNGKIATKSTRFSEQRDFFEIGLIPLLLKADKPVLAICRGLQVLNVALGGSLIEDIATELPEAGKHDWFPGYKRELRVHQVEIMPDTLLSGILNQAVVETNSLHHQSIKELGEGLVINAEALDGVIEGAEFPNKRFFLGVQWHPEHLQDNPGMRRLFKKFIEAC